MMASQFVHGAVGVIENVRLAQNTYRIRLHSPELARRIRPGQFVMIRLPGGSDPLLGRPFALYDTVLDAQNQAAAIDIVYLVVGRVTSRLTALRPADTVQVWGPLGNTLPELDDIDHIGLVAGGIGQTPFLAYVRYLLGQRAYGGKSVRRRAQRVSLFYGVRSASLAAGVEDFRRAGAVIYMASDDGSIGFKGFVTQLVENQERPQHLVGCGPEPMLRTLAGLARRWGVPCHVSLESPMACGAGICFSCVTRVRAGESWDYRRVCMDGPVFDAADLVWDEEPSR